jgi:hypothetical protein
MDVRVLPVVCVLACLAVPLYAYTFPAGAVPTVVAESIDSGEHPRAALYPESCISAAEATADTGSVGLGGVVLVDLEGVGSVSFECVDAPVAGGDLKSSTQYMAIGDTECSTPYVVILEKTGNFFVVREVAPRTDQRYGVAVSSDRVPGLGQNNSLHTVGPGEKRFFAEPVPDGAPQFWVDIRWDASAGDLRLQIYPPDGALGPYTDADDGRNDGRIFFRIASPEGPAPGDWYYEISRPGGEGQVEFSFETYI